MENPKHPSRADRRPPSPTLVGTAALIAAAVALAHPAVAAPTCAQLLRAALPGNGSVTAATAVPAGTYTVPGTTTSYPNLPAFCRVTATLRPSSDSNINVEIWLP